MSIVSAVPPTLPHMGSSKDRPSYICEPCWKGVIANQLGFLLPPIEELSPVDDLSDTEEYKGGFFYKASEEEINRGVTQGCRWCKLVVEFGSSAIHPIGTPPVPPADNIVEVRVGYGSEEKDVVEVIINNTMSWFGYVYTTKDDPAAKFVSGRNLFCEVGSEKAISFALDLVHDCEKNHPDCAPHTEPYSVLPTRVIDCSDPAKPHLFVTKGKRARYVALSYVWGENQVHKTTTKNIDSYIKSIDISILPQTIKDAIQVTNRLGLQYLWIDSLCIIQDSNEDKDHELALMHKVYSEAYLTTIAASALRVSAGFLQTRTDTLGASSVILPFVQPNATGAVSLSSWMITTPKYDPAREPLHTRGWCMQEYFLSTRELIFASHTLQYRCRKGVQNIAGADNPWWISDAQEPSPVQDLPKLPGTQEETEEVRKAWNATVTNYTKRAISYPSDKLVALMALSEEFHSVVQSPFLAGLWERTLLPDLLWSKERTRHFVKRPKDYRAPSWSWAAVDGEVDAGNAYSHDKDQTFVAEVVRCDTVLKNKTLPYGEVTAGTLVLRAPVAVDCVIMVHWMVYRLRDPKESGDPGEMIDKETGRRMQEIGYCRLDSSDEDFSSGVKRVSIVPVYHRRDGSSSDWTIQGLIVERVDSAAKEELKYRRVGFFENSRGSNEWVKAMPTSNITIV